MLLFLHIHIKVFMTHVNDSISNKEQKLLESRPIGGHFMKARTRNLIKDHSEVKEERWVRDAKWVHMTPPYQILSRRMNREDMRGSAG